MSAFASSIRLLSTLGFRTVLAIILMIVPLTILLGIALVM